MEYKLGDIVYIVESYSAKLSHQADGVELYKCKVVKSSMQSEKDLYSKKTEVLYRVGKNSYASSTILDDPFSGVMNIREWSYRGDFIFYKSLSKAKRKMIDEIFLKKKWL